MALGIFNYGSGGFIVDLGPGTYHFKNLGPSRVAVNMYDGTAANGTMDSYATTPDFGWPLAVGESVEFVNSNGRKFILQGSGDPQMHDQSAVWVAYES